MKLKADMRRTDFKCKVLRLYAEFMPNSSFHVVSRLAYLPGSGRDLVGVFWNQAGTSTRDSPHLNVEPLNVELWVCLISWWLVEPSDHLEGTKIGGLNWWLPGGGGSSLGKGLADLLGGLSM